MIHIFINALSASAGGGLTYIRNVLPRLARRDDVRTTLLVGGALRTEITDSTQVKVLREVIAVVPEGDFIMSNAGFRI